MQPRALAVDLAQSVLSPRTSGGGDDELTHPGLRSLDRLEEKSV
jgi:hypothetical protein